MFGFFFWVCLLSHLWLASFAQEENAKSCFLYPVSELKNSPLYNLEGADEHFVTVNHIFRNPNVVRFWDQNNRCVLALKQNTSEAVDCNKSIPADGEYTTLVYRRTDATFTVHKKNSPLSNIDLPEDIQTLEVSSSDMVNIAFNCPGDCYTFENAMLHINYTEERNNSSFVMYGKRQSPARKVFFEAMHGVKAKSFKSINLDIPSSDDWFQIKFHVAFGPYQESATLPYYPLYLNVSNPLKTEFVQHNLTVATKDLYLNFSGSDKVLWGISCKPGTDLSPNLKLASAPYGESRIGFFIVACLCGIFARIVIALTFYISRLGRDRTVSLPKNPAPPPPDATDQTPEDTTEVDNRSLAEHLYEYVDLTVFREQMTKENSHSLENSPEEHGASTERNSHTSINSMYGLTRGDETEDVNINGKETEIVSP